MDIHEYQAKEILSKFGVAVPIGALAYSPEQAAYRAREMGGDKWIVKAQVHAGGRGKAGGVKICNSEHEIQDATNGMFGRKLVTHQTGPEGKGIYRVYVEQVSAFSREIYLGLVLDRTSQRVMIVASSEGGMEIEEISAHRPDSRLTDSEVPSPPARSPQTHSWPLRRPPGSHCGTRVSEEMSRRCASPVKSSFMRPPAVSSRLRHCGKPPPRHPQRGSTRGIPPARASCDRCAT